MVAQLLPQPHPILACAEQLSATLSEVADLQPLYMSPEDKAAALVAVTRVERQVADLKLRLMAAAGDVADQAGARDVAAWLAHATQAEPAVTRAEAHLAKALDEKWSRVAAGMAEGTVSAEQARVIVAALDALPDRVGVEVVAKAETQLVEHAAQFRPGELRRLGRHILELVAPEIAEAEAARRLEAEEQAAQEKTSLRTKRLGDGISRTTIVHPDLDADRLVTYLDAFTSPRKHHDALSGEEDRIPLHRRRGRAFGALLEHIDPKNLPIHGGDATTVMVTITLDSLTTELATGGLIDADLSAGDNLTADTIRRLACTAAIIPAVLGGKGEILDLGRTRRLFSPAQRKAMRLRDKRCRAEGCTIPATWTEAHHLKPWSEGGTTDIDHGILSCPHHHHQLHDRRLTHEILPDGDIRFHRRT